MGKYIGLLCFLFCAGSIKAIRFDIYQPEEGGTPKSVSVSYYYNDQKHPSPHHEIKWTEAKPRAESTAWHHSFDLHVGLACWAEVAIHNNRDQIRLNVPAHATASNVSYRIFGVGWRSSNFYLQDIPNNITVQLLA